ncbi:DUF6602 domain-containing protein [Aliarcobacter vitoriensis]|uniref:DUF6602 domain-containing protein n=1 Tax=Aliarcobacter vitoriensis TaxID=2011099 RepID=UPI003AAD88FE
MGIIKDKINEDINKLKREFENNRKINHQGMKGSFNEKELNKVIKKIIPKKYTVINGVIENQNSEQSCETDIIIFDDEILPDYLKEDISFVPVEAVKYIFEVKSSLNATELKTTINKFKRYREIGGNSPTVLFAYSSDTKKSEIERYKNLDINFFTNPLINVLCVSDKCYYFKTYEEYYLKDYISNEKIIKDIGKSGGLNFDEASKFIDEKLFDNDEALNKLTRSQFSLLLEARILFNTNKRNINKFGLNLNGIEFNKIKFKIHQWIQVEKKDIDIENYEILALLSGLSNTLSKAAFGKYLLNEDENEKNFKICGLCYEDMWGNISCNHFNTLGLNCNPYNFNLQFISNPDDNHFEIIFHTNIEE